VAVTGIAEIILAAVGGDLRVAPGETEAAVVGHAVLNPGGAGAWGTRHLGDGKAIRPGVASESVGHCEEGKEEEEEEEEVMGHHDGCPVQIEREWERERVRSFDLETPIQFFLMSFFIIIIFLPEVTLGWAGLQLERAGSFFIRKFGRMKEMKEKRKEEKKKGKKKWKNEKFQKKKKKMKTNPYENSKKKNLLFQREMKSKKEKEQGNHDHPKTPRGNSLTQTRDYNPKTTDFYSIKGNYWSHWLIKKIIISPQSLAEEKLIKKNQERGKGKV